MHKIKAERILAGLTDCAILVLDSAGRLGSANAAACRLFELPDRLIGADCSDFEESLADYFRVEGEQLSAQFLLEALQLATIYGQSKSSCWCSIGCCRQLWLEWEVYGEPPESDERGYFYLVVSDRTAEKKREELRQIQLELTEILAGAKVLDDCAESVLKLLAGRAGWDFAALWSERAEKNGAHLYNSHSWARDAAPLAEFIESAKSTIIYSGQCLVGLAWAEGRTVWASNKELCSWRQCSAGNAGIKSILAFPVALDGKKIAVLELAACTPMEPDSSELALFAAVAQQLALFISRQRLEKEVAEQQDFTAKIVQTASDIFIAVDGDGNILEWNLQAEKSLGWSKAEVLGLPMVDTIIPERFRSAHREGFARALKQERGPLLNSVTGAQALCRDGREIPVSMVFLRILLGEKTIFCAFIRNLEEEMLVGAALQHSEEMFRLLVESVQDYSIVLLDPEGRYASWNTGAQRLRGLSADDALGKYFGISFTAEDIKRRLPEKLLAQAEQTGRAHDIGWRVKEDGSLCLVDSTLTALRNEAGKLKGFAKISRDITELKKSEEELRVARDRALEASNAKSAFLANMSHEIRTPLNGILGISEMLLKSPLTERQQAFVQTINEAGKSLLSVINDILDFSRIEAGKFVIDVHEFEPRVMLQSAVELLGAQAHQKNLTLSYEVDVDIPEVLLGDSMRIRQVLLNFVGNAIKFSEHGDIRLVAKLRSWQDNRPLLRFSVVDQGIGISSEKLKDLFQPFTQLDATSTRRHGGSGLGLSICKRLAELMGAEVGVESAVGRGSTFWLELALDTSIGVVERGLLPRYESRAEDVSGRRLLLISDDNQCKNLICSYLSSWGVQCKTASSAAGGLDALRIGTLTESPYHFCLVDLSLPLRADLELGKLIVSDPTIVTPGLILISPSEALENKQEALMAGFAACISKPIRHKQLLQCLIKVAMRAPEAEVVHISSAGECTTQTLRAVRPHIALVVVPNAVTQQVVALIVQDLGYEVLTAGNLTEAVELFKQWQFSVVIYDCHMAESQPFELVKYIRAGEADKLSRLPVVGMTDDPEVQSEGRRNGIDNFLSLPVDPTELKTVMQHLGLPGEA